MRTFVFILFLFAHQATLCQDLSSKLFTLACTELVQINSSDSLTAQVKGIVNLVDPIDGTDTLIYSDTMNATAKYIAQHFDKKQIREILWGKGLPIHPLADTVYVIDTLGVLSGQIPDFFYRGHYFRYRGNYWNTPGHLKNNMIYLRPAHFGVEGPILTFSFSENNSLYYTCLYKIHGDTIKLISASLWAYCSNLRRP